MCCRLEDLALNAKCKPIRCQGNIWHLLSSAELVCVFDLLEKKRVNRCFVLARFEHHRQAKRLTGLMMPVSEVIIIHREREINDYIK